MTSPILTTKEVKGVKLHPATFGLISWLSDVRKNPAVCGGDFGLQDVAELCFAFTMPSREVSSLSPSDLKKGVAGFMHDMTPELFNKLQKHAETELLKYFNTITSPKKKTAKKAPRRKKPNTTRKKAP